MDLEVKRARIHLNWTDDPIPPDMLKTAIQWNFQYEPAATMATRVLRKYFEDQGDEPVDFVYIKTLIRAVLASDCHGTLLCDIAAIVDQTKTKNGPTTNEDKALLRQWRAAMVVALQREYVSDPGWNADELGTMFWFIEFGPCSPGVHLLTHNARKAYLEGFVGPENTMHFRVLNKSFRVRIGHLDFGVKRLYEGERVFFFPAIENGELVAYRCYPTRLIKTT